MVPRHEAPSSVVVSVAAEKTPEAPASESEAEAEDFVLERRSSAARTETAAGAVSGQEVAAGTSAETPEGSPVMTVLR